MLAISSRSSSGCFRFVTGADGVGFCPSFPDLFSRVDGYVESGKGEVENFDDNDYRSVNDLCYQCKLCYFKCPYTPDDDHPFALDFPRLMLRHRAQRAKREGIALEDRLLGEPQALGAAGKWAARAGKQLRHPKPTPAQGAGIRHGDLLRVQSPTVFAADASEVVGIAQAEGGCGQVRIGGVVCDVHDDVQPAIAGQAAVQVLEHNGFNVIFPKGQTCCGMPNLDGGDVSAAQAKARANVEALFPYVDDGLKVVALQPTCGYVLKHDYPTLLGTEQARKVAEQTLDVMEFLRGLQRDKTLNMNFTQPLGKVAYHAPCHLRAQKVGFPAAQIFRRCLAARSRSSKSAPRSMGRGE